MGRGSTAMVGMAAAGRPAMGSAAMRLRRGPAALRPVGMAMIVIGLGPGKGDGQKANSCNGNQQFSHIRCPENGQEVTATDSISSICGIAIL